MFLKIEESFSFKEDGVKDEKLIRSSVEFFECDHITHELTEQANKKYERALRIWKDGIIKYHYVFSSTTIGYKVMNNHGEIIDSYNNTINKAE